MLQQQQQQLDENTDDGQSSIPQHDQRYGGNPHKEQILEQLSIQMQSLATPQHPQQVQASLHQYLELISQYSELDLNYLAPIMHITGSAFNQIQSLQANMGQLQTQLKTTNEASQHKIQYLMKEKQNSDQKLEQCEGTIARYTHMIDHIKAEGQMDKDKLNNEFHTATKIMEDSLRVQIEQLQYKLA